MFNFLFDRRKFKGRLSNSPKNSSTSIKEFSNKYSYKITKLNSLGSGALHGSVNSYKIEYLENKTLKKTIFLAGKELLPFEKLEDDVKHYAKQFEDYINDFNNLKKCKLINYSARFFSNFENVNCTNFDKRELRFIIFLTDFNLNNYQVMPINKEQLLNKDIYLFSKKNRKLIYKFILDDLLVLERNNFSVRFLDLWFIIYNKNEIFLEVVDLDFLNQTNQQTSFIYYNFFRSNSSEMKLFKDICYSNQTYQRELKKYFYGM